MHIRHSKNTTSLLLLLNSDTIAHTGTKPSRGHKGDGADHGPFLDPSFSISPLLGIGVGW